MYILKNDFVHTFIIKYSLSKKRLDGPATKMSVSNKNFRNDPQLFAVLMFPYRQWHNSGVPSCRQEN